MAWASNQRGWRWVLSIGKPFYLCKRFTASPNRWCRVIKSQWRSVKLNRIREHAVTLATSASVGGPRLPPLLFQSNFCFGGATRSITNPSQNRINPLFHFSEWKRKNRTPLLLFLQVMNSAHFQLCSVPHSHTGGWIYYLQDVTAQQTKIRKKI